MERIEGARTICSGKKITVEASVNLINYCKDLITHLRTIWTPPPEGIYYVLPKTWMEELLLICCRISDCFINDTKAFLQEDAKSSSTPNRNSLSTELASILIFAAAQLHQIDIISPIINRIIQNLSCPNIVIPVFIHTQNRTAVSLLLDAYSGQLSRSTIMTAVLSLATDPQYEYQIRPLLDTLEEDYPEQVASVRAYILLRNTPQSEKLVKCDAALRLLNPIIQAHPKSSQLLYNAAYVYALKHDKQSAFTFIQRSLAIEPNDSRALLLFLRILRSNCQYEQALKVADAARHVLEHPDKHIVVEAMFAAAENGDLGKTEALFQKLQRHWQNDPYAMNAAVRLNLLLGKPQSAAECFQHWAEYDRQSPEFFFCFAQLCLASRDYAEAERFLLYAVELAPTCGEFHAALATVFFKNGKKEKAKDRAKFAVQVDPLSVHAWVALSLVTVGAESTEACEKAAELRRTSVELHCLDLMLFPIDSKELPLPNNLR